MTIAWELQTNPTPGDKYDIDTVPPLSLYRHLIDISHEQSRYHWTYKQDPIPQLDGATKLDVNITKKCSFCGDTSETWKLLNNHIRFYHNCLHRACNYCGFISNSKPNLDDHLWKKHQKTVNN